MIKNTLLPVTEFCRRRTEFFQQMPANTVALFAANQEITRSNDTEYAFSQNRNFYYLTGFNEPDAILLLIKGTEVEGGKEQTRSVLFSREKDPMQEVWHGRRIGQAKVVQDYGIDSCFSLAELDEKILPLLGNKTAIWLCYQEQEALVANVMNWQEQLRKLSRTGVKPPESIVDCRAKLDEMRLHKSTAELDIMRQANVITGKAHQRAMQQTRQGQFEYQIEAELHYIFALNGARHPAYGSIVAGGDNANILHYTDNDEMLNDGDLLLIDAGAELSGYAADITRTFPVNGRFNEQQKIIYQLVLDSQNLAIAAIKPGQTFAQLNVLTNNFLTQGLYELGIIKGELASLKAEKASKKYFIHGLGHWLGLDVHDVGDYQINDNKEQLRPFASGMVLTIEPGIYIPADDLSVEEKWRGIGVRIEDNILVTENGYENLTVNTPKTIAEIEHLMASV